MRMMLLLAAMTAFVLVSGCSEHKTGPGDSQAQAKPGKVLRHVVLFKFKDDTTPEQIDKVAEAFKALPGKINGIRCFEWGTNVSPEQHSQGLTHAFLLSFCNEADRDSYLVHPAHKEFGQLVGPVLDKVTVVDYWVK